MKITLPESGSLPLYRLIGEEILQKVNAGEIARGEKLPAIRVLARELNVNNATVVNAYKFLEQRNAVYSVRGSGVYASGEILRPVQPESSESPTPFKNCINFAASQTSPELFPADDFRTAFDAVLSKAGAAALAEADFRGYAPLRESVAVLYPEKFSVSEISIIRNLRHGLDVAINSLLGPGDAAILETPSMQGAAAAFLARGAKIFEVPVSKNGPDMEKFSYLVKKHKPKVFFLMPNYQIPTGLCYNVNAKAQILELANSCGAYIIEADAYNDFFCGAPPVTIASMDTNGRVVYIKCFERVLAAGLAGFMVCPPEINFTGGVSGYIQRGLDYYFRNFDFAAHAAKIRGIYAKRLRRATDAARAFLSPYAEIIFPEGGLGLWVIPKNSVDAYSEIIKRGVLVSPGEIFLSKAANKTGSFRISFADTSEDEISKGIGIIASVSARGGGTNG